MPGKWGGARRARPPLDPPMYMVTFGGFPLHLAQSRGEGYYKYKRDLRFILE